MELVHLFHLLCSKFSILLVQKLEHTFMSTSHDEWRSSKSVSSAQEFQEHLWFRFRKPFRHNNVPTLGNPMKDVPMITLMTKNRTRDPSMLNQIFKHLVIPARSSPM